MMKRVLIGLLVVVVVVVVAGVAATLLVDANRFRPQVQAALGDALGRDVTLGKLHVAIWSGSLTADDIRIADDPAFGKQPFVSAQSLDVGVELWPLIAQHTLHVTSLTLDAPVVHLRRNRAGHWNFASLGAAKKARSKEGAKVPALQVDHLRINDGKFVLERAGAPTRTYDHVQISADGLSTSSAFPFAMSADIAGGGTLKLDGTLGPWDAGNATHTPMQAHLVIHKLDLVGAGLVAGDAGVGGVVGIDAQMQASKGVVKSNGELSADSLQLVAAGSPATVPLKVSYHASWRLDRDRGRISDSHIEIGAAPIAVDGRFGSRDGSMHLSMRLHGKDLPVDDLVGLLPAFGVVLPEGSRLSGGTLGLDLKAAGTLGALRITGPVTLDDSRLAGFSLGKNLGTALSLAGIKAPADTVIKHAGMTLAMTPGGVSADPFQAELTGLGTVSGKGGMAADGTLDARMLVKLDAGIVGDGAGGKQAGLGALLGDSKVGRALGGVLGGTAAQGIGVSIGGTASDPTFKLDPAAMAGLLGAGLAASRHHDPAEATDANPATVGSASQPKADKQKSPDAKDVLGSLLPNALKPKSHDKSDKSDVKH